MSTDARCPVTVLTGFLGSGKTSLLNALIRERQDIRIAVIVNEFGELGIDANLVETSDEHVVELSNGCLCCAVRSDLLSACEQLAARRDAFDWLVVETSGLADPAPIAQTFLLSDGPSQWFRLDGIVTLVDARNFARQMAGNAILARQIALADRLILTKTDIADVATREHAIACLRRYNAMADIVQSSADTPSVAALTGMSAYDLARVPDHLCFVPAPKHDSSIVSESFHFDRPFDFTAFSAFIKHLLSTRGEDVFRVKGILELEGDDRRFAFHGVQSLIDGDVVGPWGEARRHGTLVFIGRNLDRAQLEAGLVACLAAEAVCE